MSDTFINLKAIALKNNCPKCYSNVDLKLNIKQRFIETKFYKAITPEIKYQLECDNCNDTIYPALWTDDIERVFDYYRKALTPKKKLTKLKKEAWHIIITTSIAMLIIISALVYLFL